MWWSVIVIERSMFGWQAREWVPPMFSSEREARAYAIATVTLSEAVGAEVLVRVVSPLGECVVESRTLPVGAVGRSVM